MPTNSQILRKDKILSGLIETRQRIVRTAKAIPNKDRDRTFLGIWSIKDLLAHLVGWDHTNIDAAKAVMAGILPPFYNYHDRDWQSYNAMLVAQYKRDSLDELITLTKDSQHQLIELLETIPPEVFNKDFGVRFRGYKVTIQSLLEAETKDEQIHYKQIIDFFKESE